ncbi:MAG: protease modulator HflC [Alphaproteobacteria bacterium]|jgi:modulator of FtsH protease HflC|nr:protease modulator HflC [Alphaproteobacteria bacterium]
MNRKLLFGVSGLVLIAITVLVLITSAYSVHQTKTAIVFQFGNPRAVITDPGLHWKLPWRSVSYFEARVLTLDTAEEEILDKNSNRLVVDLFSRYRISDPLKFFQTLQNQRAAANKLSPIIIDSMRGVFAEYSLEAVLSEQRAQIMKRILDTANAQAQPLGVSFVDLRVRRADLPEANAQAIYESMNAERTRDANQLRAEGEEAKRAIVAGAQREVVEILANARQRAQEFRGQGDADAIRIYAEAFGQDPEFYSFYRSMEAYRNALSGEGTTFVLSPDSDFFRFFGEMAGPVK